MNLKQIAGERAAEFVIDGMTIGLGTGSTVYWTIVKIGELIDKKGLKIRAVPTSVATAKIAEEMMIPLVSFADVSSLDLTIDGADEINPTLDLIKGGGGALLREKLVAAASKKLIIVADTGKLVGKLGEKVLLPVEVVPFAHEITKRRLENIGAKQIILRQKDNADFVTDNGNLIYDCNFGEIENPADFHHEIKLLPGVVETGLFPKMASCAVIGSESGVTIIEPQKN